MLATAMVDPEFKIRWLKWWNSSTMNKIAIKFPKASVPDSALLPWLHRMSFFAGVSLLPLNFIIPYSNFKFLISYISFFHSFDLSYVVVGRTCC